MTASIVSPLMLEPQRISDSWTVLPSFLPVPGMGVLGVNAFLLKDAAPLLVDTGLAALGDDFLTALEKEIDLDDLQWIWLSHTDADHIGNLGRILAKAPQAKVVTNFLGMGKLSMLGFDVCRVELLQPGASVNTGSRTLVPLRPPYYDAPETLGFLDTREGVFFAADSFGALLPEPVETLAAVEGDSLRDGLVAWSAIDAPWLAGADRGVLANTLRALRQIAPDIVLSAHLPANRSGVAHLTDIVAEAWCAGGASNDDPLAIDQVALALGCGGTTPRL